MSDLSGLLKRLGIEIFSKDDVEINGGLYLRGQIQAAATSFSAAQQLGYRVILQLMDEYEEPKLTEKPTWEPGTVLVSRISYPEFPYRLDTKTGSVEDGDDWRATRLTDGEKSESHFKYEDWKVHRLPNEYKVGEDYAENGAGYTFLVKHSHNGMVGDGTGMCWNIEDCRHVPAPRKEAIAALARQEQADGHYHCDPFTGRHWDVIYGATPNSWMEILSKCICDLRDEVRQLKEKP